MIRKEESNILEHWKFCGRIFGDFGHQRHIETDFKQAELTYPFGLNNRLIMSSIMHRNKRKQSNSTNLSSCLFIAKLVFLNSHSVRNLI